MDASYASSAQFPGYEYDPSLERPVFDPKLYHNGRYGSMPGTIGGKQTMTKLKQSIRNSQRPALPALVGMIVVPWFIFFAMYYLRSFDLHYKSSGICNIFSFALLAPVAVFAFMTLNLAKSGDPVPMAITTILAFACWALGFVLGDASYTSFMKPFYELSNLNIYPNIDPTTWHGSQLMDAGMIQFNAGARLQLKTSMGFKNEDIYCVAPVVLQNTTTMKTVPMEHYDFWAVGINCCSGHVPDFQCGEYSNPQARWGLRVMDEQARDMYRLAVKEAEAAFNINAPHPIFVHWMVEPQAEVDAYREDGNRYFMAAVGSVAAVLFALVCAVAFLLFAMA